MKSCCCRVFFFEEKTGTLSNAPLMWKKQSSQIALCVRRKNGFGFAVIALKMFIKITESLTMN